MSFNCMDCRDVYCCSVTRGPVNTCECAFIGAEERGRLNGVQHKNYKMADHHRYLSGSRMVSDYNWTLFLCNWFLCARRWAFGMFPFSADADSRSESISFNSTSFLLVFFSSFSLCASSIPSMLVDGYNSFVGIVPFSRVLPQFTTKTASILICTAPHQSTDRSTDWPMMIKCAT